MRGSSRSSFSISIDEDESWLRKKNLAKTSVPKRSVEADETRKLAKRGLRIGRSPVGKAVFATRRISDGTCLGEIEGQVIFDDTYASRYAFDLENGAQLEPAAPFRFVNHSCEPNCAFDLIGIDPTGTSQGNSELNPSANTVRKLLIFAINDIESGEELTIDYNWPASFAIRCNCKSPTCRGWIVSRKSLERVEPSDRVADVGETSVSEA